MSTSFSATSTGPTITVGRRKEDMNAIAKQPQQQRAATRPTGTALARVPEGVLGSYRGARELDAALRRAAETCILASPVTAASVLPEGVRATVSAIAVDVGSETYPTAGGAVALGKSALMRIASAAGVSWDPQLSGRLDDGSNPYYVRWRAVGRVRMIDGSIEVLCGEKEVDMREGSPQVDELVSVCRGKARKDMPKATTAQIEAEARKRAEGQVRAIRLHIQSHAESKAMLRAIRARFGLRTSYSAQELASKPIVVLRPIYTGESSDPEIRRENAAAIRQSFLGATASLYGPAPAAMLPAPPPPVRAPAPAHVVDVSDEEPWDEVIDDVTGEVLDATPQRDAAPPRTATTPGQTPAPAQTQASEQSAPAQSAQGPSESEPVFRFGKLKGEALSIGTERDLSWYLDAVRASVEDPDKSRWRANNESHLAEIEAEIERREVDAYSEER
jgi:hypothetical protein